jgi:hypothetical protein
MKPFAETFDEYGGLPMLLVVIIIGTLTVLAMVMI